MNLAGFAVKNLGSANDFAAECRADGLMTEAYAKDRELSGQAANQVDANSGILRGAWAGRNYDGFGLAPRNFLDGNFIVAMHLDIATQLAKVLGQVVGKGIVVVEQQNHLASFSHDRGARLPARPRAPAIC